MGLFQNLTGWHALILKAEASVPTDPDAVSDASEPTPTPTPPSTLS